MQFHPQSYNMPSMQQQQQPQQNDLLGQDRAFPSPMTNSSLDSPPGHAEAKNIMQPFPHMGAPQPQSSQSSSSTSRMYDNSYTSQPSQTQPRQIVFKQHRPRQESQDNTWQVGSVDSNGSSYGALGGDNIVSPGSGSAFEDEAQQKNMQHLFEKKRRRRESHNLVERRRRDNINDRIQELGSLLPEYDASKSNKGSILKNSVEHIRMLQNDVAVYQNRIHELESLVDSYRTRFGEVNYGGAGTANNQHLMQTQSMSIPSGHPLDMSQTALPTSQPYRTR
ncbi:hypothetical protein VKS41_008091 [Umbelopsis sp. WA50703]